jgi:hypothetical protein
MTIEVGDRVAFSASFLQSIGVCTGWMPFARGRVAALEPLGDTVLAGITWDDGVISTVNVHNLVLEKRLHLEPN